MTENDLFIFLKNNFIFDLQKSKDQFCEYDCFSNYFEFIIELKCRKTHYNDLMLEKLKFDSLIKHEWKSFYINSTPQGIYLFDVKSLNPNWITDKMPKQTEFDKTYKIDKTYCLLNIKDAFLCLKY
jgi:hypothetical protein